MKCVFILFCLLLICNFNTQQFFFFCCYGGQICGRFENFVHLEVRVVNLLNVKFCFGMWMS